MQAQPAEQHVCLPMTSHCSRRRDSAQSASVTFPWLMAGGERKHRLIHGWLVKTCDSDSKVSGTQKVILKSATRPSRRMNEWVHFPMSVLSVHAHSPQSSPEPSHVVPPVHQPVCLEVSPTWLHSTEAFLSFKAPCQCHCLLLAWSPPAHRMSWGDSVSTYCQPWCHPAAESTPCL